MATAQSFTSFAMKKDGPENCEKWASCCLKAIKYTSAKCHLEAEGHKFCPFVGEQRSVFIFQHLLKIPTHCGLNSTENKIPCETTRTQNLYYYYYVEAEQGCHKFCTHLCIYFPARISTHCGLNSTKNRICKPREISS